jgi:hypothetical protein
VDYPASAKIRLTFLQPADDFVTIHGAVIAEKLAMEGQAAPRGACRPRMVGAGGARRERPRTVEPPCVRKARASGRLASDSATSAAAGNTIPC